MPERLTAWTDEEISLGMRDPSRRQRAFAALHAQFGPRLLGFLAKMCHGDRDQAEDLLGRALHKAYQGLARMEEPCRSLPGWLYTVAARAALDEFDRFPSGDPLHACVPLNDELVQALPTGAAEALSASAPAIDEAVERVLLQLEAEDPRYRALLEMEHVGACNRAEIAEATGIPRKQIAQYLKRARERFVRLAREYPALAALEPASAEEKPSAPRRYPTAVS